MSKLARLGQGPPIADREAPSQARGQKWSGSLAMSSTSTRKNRASKRRGRPGGVMARNTNWQWRGMAGGPSPRRRFSQSGWDIALPMCSFGPRIRPFPPQLRALRATGWHGRWGGGIHILANPRGATVRSGCGQAHARHPASTAPPGKDEFVGHEGCLASAAGPSEWREWSSGSRITMQPGRVARSPFCPLVHQALLWSGAGQCLRA